MRIRIQSLLNKFCIKDLGVRVMHDRLFRQIRMVPWFEDNRGIRIEFLPRDIHAHGISMPIWLSKNNPEVLDFFAALRNQERISGLHGFGFSAGKTASAAKREFLCLSQLQKSV